MSGYRQLWRGRGDAVVPWALLSPNLVWLTLFLAVPLGALFVISLHRYVPGTGIVDTWEAGNYTQFLLDGYNRSALLTTMTLGLEVSAACLVLGFPLALGLSRARGLVRSLLYFALLAPLLTSAVVRTFGWMILLANNGTINRLLLQSGLIERPLRIMFTQTGVAIALTEVLLPFMVLALDASLLNIDPALSEAALNLGAGRLRVFARVILPLTLPGIVSGSVLVFSLAISSFVTPALIGGPRLNVMSTMIYQEAIALLNWPVGAATAFVLLAAILLVLQASSWAARRRPAA